MKASLRITVLSLSVLGLAACASTSDRDAFVPPPHTPSLMDQDEAYIAAVERIARRRGIDVVWVNTPRRPMESEEDDD
ncbi:hypothetical protein [Montanilutibacter psychrotolerans]|uniref:Uncharacterized protein n=1 Tax=Montanilutibacter psychrotolerans TaxID=1327343 RepID=A0A3M8SMI0_9GAMM|nr:hypothetical protein [Lysobacter psychrotolerans]RNF82578.1 hypothetical protein EER27_13810 [Lysobacter psychrotolerans]